MKVSIGPYRSWIGPYQIASALCFWAKPTRDEYNFKCEPDWVHDFGTWLAEDKNGNDTWLTKFCAWIESKKKRNVKVRIDKYDTWSMDSTLAYIILPMLKQLQATKHGSPMVDDKDVPKELRSTSAPPKKDEWDTDANHHVRWEWVLNQMLWSFEQIHADTDWEKEYHKNGDFDIDGFKKHDEKIQKGLMLFGKYFRALWD